MHTAAHSERGVVEPPPLERKGEPPNRLAGIGIGDGELCAMERHGTRGDAWEYIGPLNGDSNMMGLAERGLAKGASQGSLGSTSQAAAARAAPAGAAPSERGWLVLITSECKLAVRAIPSEAGSLDCSD